MNRIIFILFSLLLIFSEINGQVYTYVNGPSAISPCQDLPIEIEIINDDSDPLSNVEIRVNNKGDYNFIRGSISNNKIKFLRRDGDDFVFQLDYLDACEEERFIINFEHTCSLERLPEQFDVTVNWSNGTDVARAYIVNLYNIELTMTGLRLYFDTLDQKFKKTYRIFNTGRVVVDSFSIEVTNQDKMDIISSNIGSLSSNGNLLNLYFNDFVKIGNLNGYFEPGEYFDIVQTIDIDACIDEVAIDHEIVIPCGINDCIIEKKTDLGLLALVTEPRIYLVSELDTFATPCDEGAINFRVIGFSRNTGFDQGSAIYDLVLDLGWSVYRRPDRTDPRKDNCLIIYAASINGVPITLIKNGFSGYGIKFDQFTSDPDGPGGLSDLDGDGYFDDFLIGDIVDVHLEYRLDPSCLKFSCNQEVFETRYFRVNSTFRNYCNVEMKEDRFLNHNLSWTKPFLGVTSLDKVYTDLDEDTITINLNRSMVGFLKECENDSAIITITLPNSVEVVNDAEIKLNNKLINYTRNGNKIIIITDTSRFRILIPIILHCKKGSGSGGVNTACTFCYGSGLPKSSIKVNVDYFCNEGCYNKIPLYCYNSPAFAVACEGEGAGIASEGKFVIDSLYLTRTTLGFEDSTQTNKVDPTKEDLNLSDLMTFDTFDLTMPFDIRCNANYNDILIKLIQSPIYIGNNQVGRDTLQTFKYHADTLKFYDAETNKWSYCYNVLEPQYFNQKRDAFYRTYIREVNVSALLKTCLKGRLSTADSLVFIVSGVVQDVTTRNFQRSWIRANISYNQDGCLQNMTSTLLANIYTGHPSVGGGYLDQPYRRDTNFRGFYRELSVCGIFTMQTNIDSYYSFTDNDEPFKNEFRKPYIIDEIKFVIPQILNYVPQSAYYIEEFRNSFTAEIFRDTIPLNPLIVDSAGFTLVSFYDIQDEINFKAINNRIVIDVEPNCYGFVRDTVWTTKKFRYHLQSNDPADHKTVVLKQGYAILMSGVAPRFGNKQIQPLKDSLKIWDFNLYSLTNGHQPSYYFTYLNSWMTLQNKSNHILIDSLVEMIDSAVYIKHIPTILPDNTHIYQLDSTWNNRNFKLYTSYDLCGEDSIIVWSGASCSGYPDFTNTMDDYCDEISDTQVLNYNPESARLDAVFLIQPDSILLQPCDTFYYEIKISNNGLGHAFDNILYLTKPEGLELLSADLLLNGQTTISLPPPTQFGNDDNYYWQISDYLTIEGLPGFYQVDKNYYVLQLRFLGDCLLEDGTTIAVSAKARTVCQSDVQTEKIIPNPLRFAHQTNQLDSLYDLSLSFHSDQSCEDNFEVRVKLVSINSNSTKAGQKINFSFRKELSLINDSIVSEYNISIDEIDVSRYLDWETLHVPLEKGIEKGDSIIFRFPLEKTCLAPCKTTDFEVQINMPIQIDCPTVSGGQCEQLREVQSWTFQDIVMGPVVRILDSELSTERLLNDTENVHIKYYVENNSPFSTSIQYVVRFYFDANGNGLLDPSDIFVARDSFNGVDLKAYEKLWVQTDRQMPGIYSCNLIAVVDLEDNPCLCLADTLMFPPASILPQVQYHDICVNEKLQIGFHPIANYDYQWNDSSRLYDISSSLARYNYNDFVAGGDYVLDTLLLNVSKSTGCDVVDTVYIKVYNVGVDILALDEILCFGDSTVSIRAKGIGPYKNWSYSWSGFVETSDILSGLSKGVYAVEIVDENGCSALDTIEIFEPELLEDSIRITSDYNGFDVSCYGAKDGSTNINVWGGTPVYKYNWNSSNSLDENAIQLNAGWISVTITDANGCEITDSIELNEPPPIILDASSLPAGCDDAHGGEVEINANGGVPNYNYSWSNNGMGTKLIKLPSGLYEVTITDANGCMADTSIFVDQLPDPIINVNIIDSTIIYGESIRLIASTNIDVETVQWYPKEAVDCDTCLSVYVSPKEDQQYIVEVTDSNGCSSTAILDVYIKYNEKVYIPNVFTPNGDGVNDGFTVYSSPSVERILWLEIYDRWGDFVFRTENVELNNTKVGWDGSFNSEPMNPGVYVYVTEVLYHSGKREIFSGDVTLVR